jgi:hypothetical protein
MSTFGSVSQKIRQKFQTKLMVMAWECPDGSKLIFLVAMHTTTLLMAELRLRFYGSKLISN